MPLSKFPRFPLAHLPTPLEPLDRLPRHLGGPRLYIKRDDCTGLALGGNKTRKAEFLIGAARAAGATAVIAEGGLQSNHVRQIAAAAAKAGLTCHLVLNRNVPIETAIYRENGNLLLDRVLGAVVHVCAPGQTRADAIERLLPALKKDGEVPYFIPTGGSNEIGALGYAAAALELQQQAKQAGMAIIACCSRRHPAARRPDWWSAWHWPTPAPRCWASTSRTKPTRCSPRCARSRTPARTRSD